MRLTSTPYAPRSQFAAPQPYVTAMTDRYESLWDSEILREGGEENINIGLGTDMGTANDTEHLRSSAEYEKLRANDEWDDEFWQEMMAAKNQFAVSMGRSWMGPETTLSPFSDNLLTSDHEYAPSDSHNPITSSEPFSASQKAVGIGVIDEVNAEWELDPESYATATGVEFNDVDADWELDPESYVADSKPGRMEADGWQARMDSGLSAASSIHEDFLSSHSHRVSVSSMPKLEIQPHGPRHEEHSDLGADQGHDLGWQVCQHMMSNDMDMSAVGNAESHPRPNSLDQSSSESYASSATPATSDID